MADKDSENEDLELTIADETVVTKYKTAAEIANRKCEFFGTRVSVFTFNNPTQKPRGNFRLSPCVFAGIPLLVLSTRTVQHDFGVRHNLKARTWHDGVPIILVWYLYRMSLDGQILFGNVECTLKFIENTNYNFAISFLLIHFPMLNIFFFFVSVLIFDSSLTKQLWSFKYIDSNYD